MTFKEKINIIVSLWPAYAECYQLQRVTFGTTSGKNYADLIPKVQGIEHIHVEGDEQADNLLAALTQSKDWHYYELRDWRTLKIKVNK